MLVIIFGILFFEIFGDLSERKVSFFYEDSYLVLLDIGSIIDYKMRLINREFRGILELY